MANTKVTDESGITQSNVGAAELYANDVTGGNADTKVTGDQLGENALTKTTTGLGTSASTAKGAINEVNTNTIAVTPTKAVISESNTIDCAQGSIIEMPLTQDRTLSFTNLDGGSSRVVVLTGDYTVDFNATYSTHFQSTITKRIGNVQLFTVLNYGTDGSPLYAIKDALGGLEAMIIPLTTYGEDASIGTKIRIPMIFPFYVTDLQADVSVAPTGATMSIDVHKDDSSTNETILGDKLTIDDGETSSVTATASFTFASEALRTFAKNDILQADIDTVGSTATGQGVVLTVTGYRLGTQ